MLCYCSQWGIRFTRPQAYRKNAHCRIERWNRSVVRDNVGLDRREGDEAARTLNAFYRVLRLRGNFLQPSMMLETNERVRARFRRHDGIAKAPCHRALEQPCASEVHKQKLRQELAGIKPLAIGKEILTLTQE